MEEFIISGIDDEDLSYTMMKVAVAIEMQLRKMMSDGKSFSIEPFPRDLWVHKESSREDGVMEWISSNCEDGSASTVLRNGEWWYFKSSEEFSEWRRVPGGAEEVIANWICYFTG